MYEVELKVELTETERQRLISQFKDRNFASEGVTPQHDYYIQADKSPYDGYDLKRYRNEDGTFIYTEKIWEMVDGQPARRENEHEVSQEEFDSKVKTFPNAVAIHKKREWFTGKWQDVDVSITIDTVKFSHSPAERYFIEAEVDTNDKTKVKETKENIRNFLQELLGRSEIVEAPGMFAMAFEKK